MTLAKASDKQGILLYNSWTAENKLGALLQKKGCRDKSGMTYHQILVLITIQLLILLLPSVGLFKMFGKAGVAGWKAFVPFYNTRVMLELAERPRYWVYLQLVPIAGWFVSMGIFVEFVKTFGKFRFYQHAMAALLPVFYFLYTGFSKREVFLGTGPVKKHKKGTAREWIDAAVFAVVAATLIRTFVFEAYVIPSGSMEKTLLVNDYLFVSKLSYGPRLPNTPLAIPFVHNTLPLLNIPSYLQWIRIPYVRWFARPVQRGDVVVFNFPAGDTVINREEYQSKITYYRICRSLGEKYGADSGRKMVLNDPDQYPLILRPVDKKENFIKRCVAVAGDTLLIRDGTVYINGKPGPFPPESETWYKVTTGGQPLDEDVLKEEYQVDMQKPEEFQPLDTAGMYRMLLSRQARDKMLKSGWVKAIAAETDHTGDLFPYDAGHAWTCDNYGPLWVPARGATISLTAANFPLYERAIRVYEGNKLEMRQGTIFLNDRPASSYTFTMDYYWMMGDNRHDSEDSRFWGFVPEDHVVGGAWVIWMSWDKGVRWRRLFKRIR